MKKIAKSITIDTDIANQIEKQAVKEGRNFSNMVEYMSRGYLQTRVINRIPFKDFPVERLHPQTKKILEDINPDFVNIIKEFTISGGITMIEYNVDIPLDKRNKETSYHGKMDFFLPKNPMI